MDVLFALDVIGRNLGDTIHQQRVRSHFVSVFRKEAQKVSSLSSQKIRKLRAYGEKIMPVDPQLKQEIDDLIERFV